MLGRLSEKEIEDLISRNHTARLGCCYNNEVYVVPITYVYDGENLYSHSNEGRKIDFMRRNPQVCVEIDEIEDIFNWKSVISYGVFKELSGDEGIKAFQLIYEKLATLLRSNKELPEHPHDREKSIHERDIALSSSIVYKIKLLEKTGRFERIKLK